MYRTAKGSWGGSDLKVGYTHWFVLKCPFCDDYGSFGRVGRWGGGVVVLRVCMCVCVCAFVRVYKMQSLVDEGVVCGCGS